MTKSEPPRNEKIYKRSTRKAAYSPPPPEARPEDVWRRIEELVDDAPTVEKATKTERTQESVARSRRWKRRRVVLDGVGLAVWAWVLIKLFVFDFDRAILGAVAPSAVWILDARILVALGVASLLLLLFKARSLGLGLAYVVGYPAVVLAWKLPRLLIKKRSPLLVVGLLGILTTIVARFRRIVVAATLLATSILIVTVAGDSWLIYVAIVSLILTLMWSLTVTCIDLLRTPRFIAAQEKLIHKVLSLKLIEKFTSATHPDRISLKSWTADDAKKYRDSAGHALLARRLLYFWAYSLDEYRKGPWIAILNATVAVGMILQVMLVFTFVGYGVYLIDPGQYSYLTPPEWWTFAYSAASGTVFGEIGALTPVGGLAVGAKLLNGLVGSVGVGTVLISIFIGYRSARAESSSISAVELLRSKAEYVESLSAQQFRLSVRELEQQLSNVSWNMLGILVWIGANTPVAWSGSRATSAAEEKKA